MARKTIFLLGIFNIAFLACFAVLTVCVGLYPTINKFGLFQPSTILFVLGIVLTAILIVLANVKGTGRMSRLYPLLISGGFVVTVSVQLVVARALISRGYTWDSEFVIKQAISYAVSGSIQPWFVDYMRSNPNNIGVLTLLSLYFKLLRHLGVKDLVSAAVYLNATLLLVAQGLTYRVARMLYGKRVAALSLIFIAVFLSLSMYVQIPYTDTLTVAFPITILYLGLQFIRQNKPRDKILLIVLLGIITVLGYMLKPTVIFATFALFLAVVIWFATSKTWKSLVIRTRRSSPYVIAALIAVAGTYVLFARVVDMSHILPYKYADAYAHSTPIIHFAAMGMITTVKGYSYVYGGYNSASALTDARLQTQQAKQNFSIDEIKRQLIAYGPFGYASFLEHKLVWIMSDATFFAYGEGDNQHVTFTHQDRVSVFIRQYMYVSGRRFLLFGNILHVFWIALLLLISMQLLFVLANTSSRYNIYPSIIRFMLTGIILFLLFFEGRSRYIFLYVPIFIMLALYTLRRLQERTT